MGNQGYSNEGTRQAAEMIWSGEIGNVTEVHAWTDRPDLAARPHRDPAARCRFPPRSIGTCGWASPNERPFTSGGKGYPNNFSGYFYHPFNWRGFYDFGCGALGDMACHILGAPNMALCNSARRRASSASRRKARATSCSRRSRSSGSISRPAAPCRR